MINYSNLKKQISNFLRRLSCVSRQALRPQSFNCFKRHKEIKEGKIYDTMLLSLFLVKFSDEKSK